MRYQRDSRLLKSEDFREVLSASRERHKGRYQRGPWYVVYQRFTEAAPRLGISISGKIVRSSPKRNRIKRCLREFFRKHRKELSGDILVRCAHTPTQFAYDELSNPLKQIILREQKRK